MLFVGSRPVGLTRRDVCERPHDYNVSATSWPIRGVGTRRDLWCPNMCAKC